MSATHDDDESDDRKKNVSARIHHAKVDQFDRVIKKAQLDGDLPMDFSRSDAIRQLVYLACDDPSLLTEADE